MADQFMGAGVELAALNPEVWSAAFYPTLLAALPFNDVVARQYEGEIRALGNTVNISSFPEFGEADDLAESQKSDAKALTASGQQLVINHQLAQDFIITNLAMVQTIEAGNAIRDLAFHSIMKKMQTILIGDTVPSAAAPDHSIAYDSGTTLALADILEAKELLDASDVEDDGSRCMILGSAQWNDIFNITGLTSRDFVDGRALQDGSLPARVLGFNPKLTTEAANVAFFFHPIYMTMAVQRGLSSEMFNMGGQGYRSVRVNNTILMGNEQLSDLRVVTIS